MSNSYDYIMVFVCLSIWERPQTLLISNEDSRSFLKVLRIVLNILILLEMMRKWSAVKDYDQTSFMTRSNKRIIEKTMNLTSHYRFKELSVTQRIIKSNLILLTQNVVQTIEVFSMSVDKPTVF